MVAVRCAISARPLGRIIIDLGANIDTTNIDIIVIVIYGDNNDNDGNHVSMLELD